MKITRIRSLWPEDNDFIIDRENIGNQYIFVHFLSPVKIYLNGNIISADEGSCILYDKFSHQKMYPDDCSLLHDWFHIEGDMNEIVGKYGFSYNKIYTVSNGSKITKIVQALENEYNAENVFSEKLIAIKIEELIISVIRGSGENERNNYINSDMQKSFYKLRSKINLTYNEDWDVDKMAAEVNLSPSRFYRIYKELFGISPKKYLNEIRIEHAKTLLMQNKYMIKEIAEMAGYKNQYHFIRQFKDYTGTTPGKYCE